MKTLYITPLGKTASKQPDALIFAKKQFNFDVMIILTSASLYYQIAGNLMTKYPDINVDVVPIKYVYRGNSDFQDIVTLLLQAVNRAEISKEDKIIINSSGGTEKMSCIIHRLNDILKHQGFNVKHVFGTVDIHSYEVLFTEVPKDIGER